MPKFVLIDQSLQGVGGHHFEYALNVLQAAEQLGFEPWLATHRKFHDRSSLDDRWHVLSLYRRGTYSKRRIGAHAGSEPRREQNNLSWLADWWNNRRRAKLSSTFAHDTAALFRQVALEAGDQVFLPTVSELELLGLAHFLARDSRTGAADWHLQYHFPIYSGYEPDHPAREAALKNLSQSFCRATTLVADHRLHFYVTTESLAEQYNRMEVGSFHVLPFPSGLTTRTPGLRVTERSGPLRVACQGGARFEKGYHLLPQIIDAVWEKYVATGQIRFHIQSDCDFPLPAQGNNALVLESKTSLAKLPEDFVTLSEQPLSSDEFCHEITLCDIGLLPYDREAYSARCSGVLLDLLSAGVPVVVPAGTWLADQLADSTRDYHSSLRQGRGICGRTSTRGGDRLAIPKGTDDLLLFLRWPVDPKLCEGAYAKVEAAFWGEDGAALAQWPIVVGPGRPDRLSTGLVRPPQGAEFVAIQWRNAYTAQAVDFREVEICFSTTDAERSRPLGAVGLTAADPSQYAALLAEIIEHYAHYRQTAALLAPRLRETNSPSRVVLDLLAQRASIPFAGEHVNLRLNRRRHAA